MLIPILASCDTLVLGGGISAMVCALSHHEEDVLLATQKTFVYAEIIQAGDFRVSHARQDTWKRHLFPAETLEKEGILHPDRLKCYGEALLQSKGIRLLYAVNCVSLTGEYALIAHKSGLYAVKYNRVYDCRQALPFNKPAFCLHFVQPQHHFSLVGDVPVGNDAWSTWQRFNKALLALPKGASLARCGTAATEQEGLEIHMLIQSGLEAQTVKTCDDMGSWSFYSENPLSETTEKTEIKINEPDCFVYDAIVAGGGTSGAVAALYLAKQGKRTLLLEMNDRLGGTATIGGVSTYWFGNRTGATQQIDKAVRSMMERLHLPMHSGLWGDDDVFYPDLKAHVLLEQCLNAGVQVELHAIACGVEKSSSGISGLVYAQNGRLNKAQARIVVDCTGDGDVCMFAGADHVYGSEVDGITYWASLAQYPTSDSYRNNFSTLVNVGDPLDYTRFILQSRKLGITMYDHGQYVAPRESRHIRGLSQLTLRDILSMRKTEDVLYTCFSNYDPKGRLTADIVYIGFLPPNQQIDVPRGTVIPVDQQGAPIGGLLIGGKAISCTHDAFPALRMQPDMQQQGLAISALAALTLEQKLPTWKVHGVQERILKLVGETTSAPVFDTLTVADAARLLERDAAWEWLDVRVDSYIKEVPGVAAFLLLPAEQAVPKLLSLYRHSQGELKLSIARLLLWHGDENGLETILEALQRMFDSTEGLPQRTGSINFGQMLPDHGLMPEAVYLLNSLSHINTPALLPLLEEMVSRLERFERDWFDIRKGIYCYCESVSYLADKQHNQDMVPLLLRVRDLPEIKEGSSDLLLRERLMMLDVFLCGSLHRLGELRGTNVLYSYCQSNNRSISLAAWKYLERAVLE